MTNHPPPCPHRTYAVSPEAALLTSLEGWQPCWLNQQLLLSLPVPWNSLLSSTLELTLVSHWLLPCPPPSGHSLILLLWAAVDKTHHPCVYSPGSIICTRPVFLLGPRLSCCVLSAGCYSSARLLAGSCPGSAFWLHLFTVYTFSCGLFQAQTLSLFHRVGNGNSLQYSYLKNPMDRGACWVTFHGVTNSQIWLSGWSHNDRKSPWQYLYHWHLPWAWTPNRLLQIIMFRKNACFYSENWLSWSSPFCKSKMWIYMNLLKLKA